MCKVANKVYDVGEFIVVKVLAKSLNGWLILATKIALFILELLNWITVGFLWIWDHVIYPIILSIRKCRERSTGQLKKKVKLFVKKVIDTKNIVWPFLRDKIMYPIIEFIQQTTYKTIDLVKRVTIYLQQKIIDSVEFIRSFIYKIYCVIYDMINTLVV